MSQRGGKEEEKPEEIIEMSLGTRKGYSCSMEIGREEIRGKSKIPQRGRGKELTARAKANVGAKRALAPSSSKLDFHWQRDIWSTLKSEARQPQTK